MMIERTKVLVVWHDAHSVEEGWMSENEIDNDPLVVESIGFLLPEKKSDHVVIAQSITADGNLDSVLAIPVGMVQRLVVLGSVSHDVPPFGIVAGAGDARG